MIRCDNCPEYICGAIQNWAAEWDIRLEHIQPGNLQQNAYVEPFNRMIRVVVTIPLERLGSGSRLCHPMDVVLQP